jgi:hypothetical protein
MPSRYQFKIHISGKGIKKDLAIKASLLAKHLRNLNNLAQHVVNFRKLTKHGLSVEDFEFYFIEFLPGGYSAVCEFRPGTHYSALIGIDPIEEVESEISEVFEKTQEDGTYKYFQEKYPISEERTTILKVLSNFSPSPQNSVDIIVVDKRHDKKVVQKSAFTKKVKERIESMLEKEKPTTPKLIGEYTGFNVSAKEAILFITLLNGENVKCYYSEHDFQEQIEKLESHELVQITGEYNKPPGRNTQAKITSIERIHKIDDEFTMTFEEYKKLFANDEDLLDPEFEKDLRAAYEVFKENYSVLKLLGED